MNRRRWILVLLSGIGLGMFQALFLSLLPYPWNAFQPILALGVILVVLNRSHAAILFTGISGFFLHLFSLNQTMLPFAWLMVTMVLVSGLSQTVLTNRSMYAALALVILARLVYQLILLVLSSLLAIFLNAPFSFPSLQELTTVTLWDVGFVGILFLFVAFFTRRLLVTVSRTSVYGA